jgi:hypothetical protein
MLGSGVVYVVPVIARIWRQKDRYFAVVTDPFGIETLLPYVGRDVTVELEGLEISAKLRRLQQRLTYVGIELPTRLNPHWAKLWSQDKSHKMLIKIIGDGKPAPEGQGKTGEAA